MNRTNDSNLTSYRRIMHGMAIFGGTQFYQSIVGILKLKISSILLGPAGMGIAAILTSLGLTIQQSSSLGCNIAAVREIANDTKPFATVVATLRKLLIATAIAGALFTVIFAKPISRLTFGEESTVMIAVVASLGIYVVFSTLANGESAILQGRGHLRQLAIGALVSSTVGLLAAIPLYYFFGTRGIVPAMIVQCLTLWLYCRFKVRRLCFIPKTSAFDKSTGRSLLWMGTVLVAASSLGSLTTYLIQLYVRSHGGETVLGYYSAASQIATQGIAIVFASLSLEFFPRLSSMSDNRRAVNIAVNRQIEASSMIASAVACWVILLAPLVVRVLLTSDYLPVTDALRWFVLSVVIRSISYPMGYISFTKSDKTTFFLLEGIVGNVVWLALTVGCYCIWGLVGTGIGICVTYLIDVPVYMVVCRKLYGFRSSTKCALNAGLAMVLTTIVLTLSVVGDSLPMSIIAALVATSWSVRTLLYIKKSLT